eukprot:GHVH01010696.1.p1 GENE.GHVH01010696.1~~GHVH01010696.1.p1  ORF type:complete len:261 (+),score=34.75 GHVH01010696.1:108-890(+)
MWRDNTDFEHSMPPPPPNREGSDGLPQNPSHNHYPYSIPTPAAHYPHADSLLPGCIPPTPTPAAGRPPPPGAPPPMPPNFFNPMMSDGFMSLYGGGGFSPFAHVAPQNGGGRPYAGMFDYGMMSQAGYQSTLNQVPPAHVTESQMKRVATALIAQRGNYLPESCSHIIKDVYSGSTTPKEDAPLSSAFPSAPPGIPQNSDSTFIPGGVGYHYPSGGGALNEEVLGSPILGDPNMKHSVPSASFDHPYEYPPNLPPGFPHH